MADMTKREMLNAVIENKITDEVIAKAKAEIKALDDRNEKRKSTPSKSVLENVKVKEDIMAYLDGKDFTLGTEIADGMGLSKNKVGSLCALMVKEGTLVGTDLSVKGVGKRKAYKVA